MTSTFINLLRQLAKLLGRFAEDEESGSLRWNGKAYSTTPQRRFDPHAAKWWATLNTLAEMLDAQNASISKGQRAYLDRLLFGGMGSLNDFQVDERRIGQEAKQVNEELRRLTKTLFDEFRRV
jgi:uncharacterized protein YukE